MQNVVNINEIMGISIYNTIFCYSYLNSFVSKLSKYIYIYIGFCSLDCSFTFTRSNEARYQDMHDMGSDQELWHAYSHAVPKLV